MFVAETQRRSAQPMDVKNMNDYAVILALYLVWALFWGLFYWLVWRRYDKSKAAAGAAAAIAGTPFLVLYILYGLSRGGMRNENP